MEILNFHHKEIESPHRVSQGDIVQRLILFLFSCLVLDHKGTVSTSDFLYSYKFYILYIQYVLCIELIKVMAASEIFVFTETHQRRRYLKRYKENQLYYIMCTASTIFHSI